MLIGSQTGFELRADLEFSGWPERSFRPEGKAAFIMERVRIRGFKRLPVTPSFNFLNKFFALPAPPSCNIAPRPTVRVP
jgi:hypothetical protein